MQVYKITEIKTGLIYIGKDRNDDPYYYGSGKWFKPLVEKRIKDYIENILKEKYNGKKKKKYIKDFGHLFFKKEILDQCYSLDEMSKKEVYWIEYYNSTDKKIGFNLTKGPGTYGFSPTDETREKIRCSLSTKIYQYDLELNLVKIHSSIINAHKETGVDFHSIVSCCKGKNRLAGPFVWSYNKIIDINIINKLKDDFKTNPYIDNTKKIVYKYSIEDCILLSEYDTLTNASNDSNIDINSIIFNCKNKRMSAGGFIWSYNKLTNEQLNDKIKKINYSKENTSYNKMSIKQFTLDGIFIKEWNYIKKASKETNTNYGSICNCCKGKQKSAGGFIWKYSN